MARFVSSRFLSLFGSTLLVVTLGACVSTPDSGDTLGESIAPQIDLGSLYEGSSASWNSRVVINAARFSSHRSSSPA